MKLAGKSFLSRGANPAGIILVNKPRGIRSRFVVDLVQKFLPRKTKVGHGGTLDPLAEGLLVILVGREFTRQAKEILSGSKTYEFELLFGVETSSGDLDGEILRVAAVPPLSQEKLQSVCHELKRFGFWQTPPIASAIKVGGKPLYSYLHRQKRGSRKNPKFKKIFQEISSSLVQKRRKIELDSLELLHFSGSVPLGKFVTTVPGGTYIRSLGPSIARRIGSIGTVTTIRRLSIGEFSIENAIKLMELPRFLREKLG